MRRAGGRFGLAIIAVAACGRISFDEIDGDGEPVDASVDADVCGPSYITQPPLASRYRLSTTTSGWFAAEADCESDGGHLIVIDDAAENAWVMANVTLASVAWVGGGDWGVEGTFGWVTGDPFSFSPWSANEPNNFELGQDCLQVFLSSGLWNDSGCSEILPYACECDGTSATSPKRYCDTTSAQTCGECGTVCSSGQSCSPMQMCQ